MIDEEIIKKIVNRDFESLTLNDHYALGSINKDFDLTRQLWTYTRQRQISFYWPQEITTKLLNWNKDMINYYLYLNQPMLIKQKKNPTVIKFSYQINYENGNQCERQTALGKFIHYKNEITIEEWKELKERLRDMIRSDAIEKKNNSKILSIKIYNINKKDNGYESDDVYAFKCEDKSFDEEIIQPMTKPKIPDELIARYYQTIYPKT